MTKSNIIIILLAIALVALSAKMIISDSCCSNSTNSVDTAEIVLNNIATRTSIRAYADTPVDSEIITKIVKAGMAAPTAVNKQPWAFIAVDNKELLQQLGDSLPYAKMTAQAAFAIVVCGDMNKAIEGEGRAFWIQDTSAATENILLAAHGLGLGAVWTGVYPNAERIASVRSVLNIPQHLIPLCVIPMGYPAVNSAPKDKWKDENLHFNSF